MDYESNALYALRNGLVCFIILKLINYFGYRKMLGSISLAGTEVVVYRDDLNHATVSGNKLHKLAPNIKLAKDRGCSRVLSFGGPYSNHLHALAWACRNAGLASIGVIRGELRESLTPTLRDCQHWGMELLASSTRISRFTIKQRVTDIEEQMVAA